MSVIDDDLDLGGLDDILGGAPMPCGPSGERDILQLVLPLRAATFEEFLRAHDARPTGSALWAGPSGAGDRDWYMMSQQYDEVRSLLAAAKVDIVEGHYFDGCYVDVRDANVDKVGVKYNLIRLSVCDFQHWAFATRLMDVAYKEFPRMRHNLSSRGLRHGMFEALRALSKMVAPDFEPEK